jgi:Ca2+-binding RTX toxin-like protein
MTGGNGNDTYFVDDIGDVVIEQAGGGNDNVVVIGLENYRLSSNVEVGRMGDIASFATTASGLQNMRGNELDNRINGNASRNQLQGEDGDDTLYGYGGDDLLNGGNGNDHLNGGDGQDMASYKVGATSGVTVDLARQGVFQDTGGAGSDKLEFIEDLEGTEFSDTLLGDGGANGCSAWAAATSCGVVAAMTRSPAAPVPTPSGSRRLVRPTASTRSAASTLRRTCSSSAEPNIAIPLL